MDTDQRERGATLVEYALGLALMALALVAGVQAFQDAESDQLQDRGDRIGMPDLDESPHSTTPTTSNGGSPGPSDPPPGTVSVSLGPGTTSDPSVGEADGNNKWKAVVTFHAVDGGGASLEGVTITGSWSPAGSQSESSCTTDSSGMCEVIRWNMSTSGGNAVDSAQFVITSVTGSGYQDDGTVANRSFTVTKP